MCTRGKELLTVDNEACSSGGHPFARDSVDGPIGLFHASEA